jgi:tRNA nucleotidyltransferase (CCA-adding enzyme)
VAGIVPALPSLAKVSRERVCEELRKILDTAQPSRGLVPAIRTGIMTPILPDVQVAVERVDRATPRTRLAALMASLASPDALPVALDRGVQKRVGEILRALKFSNAELELAASLVAVAHAPRELSWTPASARRLLAQLRRDQREPAVELWDTYDGASLGAIARGVLGDPLEVGDLALTGKQLMDALQMPPGPAIGRILGMLLQYVLDDPAANTREALLARAQTLELEVGR